MKWILPLLALVACLPQTGSGETTYGTDITAVPYTITKSGVYRFTKNLVYTPGAGTSAIRIAVAGVVIDLNGYELVASSTASTAMGIAATSENRITIKNGTIGGFQNGVVLTSDYAKVTDLLVTNSLASGISVVGNHAQICHNRVVGTGPGTGTPAYAIGIALTGTDGTVSDNDVHTTIETDASGRAADGIRIKGCSNIVVSNNRVADVEPLAPTKATATGIAIESPSDTLVLLSNTVLTTDTAFDLSGGTSGKYGDNITSSFTTDYFTTGSGMTSIGNNN